MLCLVIWNVTLRFLQIILIVLALWSNYLDNLFFSSKESEEIYEFDDVAIKYICGYRVNMLFNICLNRNSEFHEKNNWFDLARIGDVLTLEMPVPWNLIQNSNNFSVSRFNNEIMDALELVDRFNLQNLKNKCVQEFRSFNENDRKQFLAKHQYGLMELSMSSSFLFLAKCFDYESERYPLNDCFPVRETEELDWKSCETGVNTRQDVCLLVGEERFKVHKEYLAFWSPYFDRLFFGNFIEKEMTEMEIKEVEPQEFGTLLRLIYPPGDVKIDDSNVVFLLKLADRFEIKSVMAMCCSYLARKVIYLSGSDSPEQLVDILELADQYFLVDAQLAFRHKISFMNDDKLKKFIEDYRDRLADLSENTRKFIVPSM